MNFLLFSLQSLANILTVIYIPDNIAIEFFQGYSAGNIVFSLIGTLLFTSIERNTFYKALVYFPLSILIGGAFFNSEIKWLAFFYPCAIVFTDLATSQMTDGITQKIIRIILILSGLPLLISNRFVDLIHARYYLLVAILFCLIIFGNKAKNLNIKTGILYLFCIYSSYSLVLFLMVRIPMEPIELKYWYLLLQISLVIMLKIIDFRSRLNSTISGKINIALKIISLSLIFIAFVLYPNTQALLLAIIGWLGLLITEKYILINGK